jgi:predicted transcriptional regulator
MSKQALGNVLAGVAFLIVAIVDFTRDSSGIGVVYRLAPTELSTALILTKRLNALEGRGLIRREPDPSDGRSKAVSLTREGERLIEAILPEHVANEQRLLSELSTKRRTELAGLLEMLAISLGDESDSPRRRAAPARRRRRG